MTGALQSGHTRIFRSSGLTGITGEMVSREIIGKRHKRAINRSKVCLYAKLRSPLNDFGSYASKSQLMKNTFLVLSALCLTFFQTCITQATTVQRLGLEDLIKKAHSIVVGKVSGTRTYWSADRKLIFTNFTIQ